MTNYYCEQCNHSSPSGLYFQRHLGGKWHKTGEGTREVFTCDTCNWKTSRVKRAYEKHMESLTHKKNLVNDELKKTGYFCDLCQYGTTHNSNYTRYLPSEKHNKKAKAKQKSGTFCAKCYNFDIPFS